MSKRNKLVEQHWRKNYSRLTKVIVRRVPNNSPAIAEEVVQEAYTNALMYFRTYDPGKSEFATWFERILRNAVSRCRSTEGPVNQLADDDTQPIAPSKHERELSSLILQEIDASSGAERDILVMFYKLGFKTIEISEYMNKSHTAVRQVIFRWRNKVGIN